MKKFLLTAAVVFLLGGSIHALYAQPTAKATTTQKTMHRKGLSIRKTTDPKSWERTSSATLTTKDMEELKRAPLAPKDLQKHDFLPYDTLLWTGHIRQENGITVLDEKIEYDEYGLYHMLTIHHGSDTTERRYTYRTGIANYWTSRLIEERQNGGSWKPVSKEERTINDQEQLTSVKIYDSHDGKLYLSSWREYDYSHEFVRDGETHSPGALTRRAEYEPDGTVTQEKNYTWFEPAKDYICTLLIDPHGFSPKIITKFEGNTTVTDYYQTNADSTSYVREKVTRYYGKTEKGLQVKGEMRVGYYEDGEEAGAEGNKTEYKGFGENGQLVPGQDAEYWNYSYNYYDKTWSLIIHRKGHWLNNNLLEIYDVRSEFNYYELYNDEGMPIDPARIGIYDVKYDSKLQQFTVYDYRDMNNVFINLYDLQNNLIARYRQQPVDLGLNKTAFAQIYADEIEMTNCKVSEWKNGQWQPRTEPMVFEEYYKGKVDERGFYYFNEKGEMVKEEWYAVSPENPEGTLEEQYIFTYKENEITSIKTFDSDGAIADPSNNKTWLKRLADGNYEYASLDYEYGRYTLFDVAQGYAKIYCKDPQDIEWKEYDCKYVDLVSVDPETGVETRIFREHNPETGQAVYTYKTERLDDPETGYHLEADYTWDTERNAWRGKHCDITEPRQKDLPIRPVHYPKSYVYDDYSNYPAEPKEGEGINMDRFAREYNTISYEWGWYENETDGKVGDWVPVYFHILKVTPIENGGYYVLIQDAISSYQVQDEYWLELNDQQQIVKLQTRRTEAEIRNYQWEYEYYRSDIDLTYNEQGLVSERIEYPYKVDGDHFVKTDDIWKDLYIYTAAQVTPTEIDEVKNHDEGFTRNGREIRTAEGVAVTVYDLSGRQVAAGTGHLTLPNSGIFLINCNGKTTKVSCR